MSTHHTWLKAPNPPSAVASTVPSSVCTQCIIACTLTASAWVLLLLCTLGVIVNSYFRSILTSAWPADGEDFDSKPSSTWQLAAHRPAAALATPQQPSSDNLAHEQQFNAEERSALDYVTPVWGGAEADEAGGTASASATTEPAAGAVSSHLDLCSLPANALEAVLSHLDLSSLLSAACSCRALCRAAQAERIWQSLFQQRWGSVMFPINRYSSSRSGGSGSRGSHATPPGTGSANSGAGTASTAAKAVAALSASGVAEVDAVAAGAAGSCTVAERPPVPAFRPDEGQSRTAVTATVVAGHAPASTSQGTAATAVVGPLQPGHELESSRRSSSDASGSFISRWTGSHLPAKSVKANTGMCSSSSSSGTCACHKQQLPSSQTQLPAAAPAGSWRVQYKQQHSYQAVRRCPKCGDATVVPIVYGFPSAPLLSGMSVQRLVLGGDHLIEACHVWACSGCRSCFRYFPFTDVQLWLQDDEAQQRMDQARAAARGRRSGGGGGQQQSGGSGTAIHPLLGEDEAAAAGLPRYTYEL